jgi:hypothetical protein
MGPSVGSRFPQNAWTTHSLHALVKFLVFQFLNVQVSPGILLWSSLLLEPVDEYKDHK